MFRRRIPRARRRAARQGPHPLLIKANDLMNAGDYISAAALFDEMASKALSRNGPAAPHLLIQAGKAKIQADQVSEGLVRMKKALGIFAQKKEWIRFQRTRARVVDQLTKRGLVKEAEELNNFMSDSVPDEFSSQITAGSINPVSKAIARLPVSCPGCGGPIRSDQVEWIDEITAECPFCGRVVRD
ncbi:hypothetical protein ACFLTX_00495 [Chloroflexota bacterium]